MTSPAPKPAGGHRLTVPPGFAPPPLGGKSARSDLTTTMTTITTDLAEIGGLLTPGEDLSDLQLIADSLTALAGFEMATISVARADGHLHMVVVSGQESARADLLGTVTPIEQLEADLARADDWGTFKFVPAERLESPADAYGWVPAMAPSGAAGAWNPLDLLVAPLRDDTGRLRGTLMVDIPTDGLRPDREKRAVLSRHAVQAQRAILLALEREELSEQVRLAEAARDVIRRAGRELDPDEILNSLSTGLVDVLDLTDFWLHMSKPGGRGIRTKVYREDFKLPIGDLTSPFMVEYGQYLWDQRSITVQTPDGAERLPHPDPEAQQRITEWIRHYKVGSIVGVPIGSGQTWYGAMLLGRGPDKPHWSELELITAADLGRDFGRVVHNSRAYLRQKAAVDSLRELEAHKSRLIATVAHELKNPLSAFRWNIESLPYAESEEEYAEVLTALTRNRDRTEKIVADLAMLSKVSDPDHLPTTVPIQVARVLEEVYSQLSAEMPTSDAHELVFEMPPDDVHVTLAPGDLDRVVINLVTNAIKYSPDGGQVIVSTRTSPGWFELRVTDHGLGISPEDQERLFTEFFRSTNPTALKQPGTGLGLTIVSRIVSRRGGLISVDSTPGVGSTFRVTLPIV
ncbi:HAMP domain-containing histidine kinase [Nocardioides sp. KC13]|uniref:histidine kinase n=1 Tax=Nocardioides turkmenicus TaxID=2711220 RepID=A0A6M1RBA4_9ACTN|nr:HAMP domain-containing sensor histidine kinase [Nocardioides sp. KC13]NGN93627.1 HAMP domain-containing histidine kinase [Nocardioides sp. KC13]